MSLIGTSLFNLNDLIKNSLYRNKDRNALNFEGEKMSYEELHKSSNRVAHSLIKYGVQRNTRVAMLLSNRLEYVVVELAIYLSGGTKIALNNMLGQEDIMYILQDSMAEILLIENKYIDSIHKIKKELPHLKRIVVLDMESEKPSTEYISWNDFIKDSPVIEIDINPNPKDLSFILYTGGTTGYPKGVVHNRQTTSLTYISMIIETNIQHDEKILLNTPLPHAAGLYLFAGLIKGAEIFIENKFRPQKVINKIEQEKVTFLSLVPTTLYRLLDYMGNDYYDVSSIRTIQYGTAPISYHKLKKAIEVFGQVFIQAYGLTETQSVVAWLKKEDHNITTDNLSLLKSCGKPSIFSRIKIVNKYGDEVEAGIEGEIIVNTSTNMIEYLGLSVKTLETLKDGWLYTGDVGYKDDEGYLYLLDRKKDMIISGGMNVYSVEVENVIEKHPNVQQAAVIGIPDEDWGEIVIAFVILKKTTTKEDIESYCKKVLSKYKIPKLIHLVETLPLTTYGKIDKKSLRNLYWSKDKQI